MPVKISIIIPSAPERLISDIFSDLVKIKPEDCALEILIVKSLAHPVQRHAIRQTASGKYIFLFNNDIAIPFFFRIFLTILSITHNIRIKRKAVYFIILPLLFVLKYTVYTIAVFLSFAGILITKKDVPRLPQDEKDFHIVKIDIN